MLDLCTGTADLALAATDLGPRAHRVIGIDFSVEMLKIGRGKVRRARPAGSAAVDLVRGDATRIPLASAAVDAVTIGFGIRNVDDPLAACREIFRVLRGDGKLVILEFSLPRPAALRRFYLWYFRRVLPLVGRAISKHPSAYTYLPQSVESFPSPGEFLQELRRAGFGSVHAIPLTFGIVYMFVAVKDSAVSPGAIID